MKDYTKIIPAIIVALMCLYWIISFYFPRYSVSNDPYLLGFFRGFIWPTVAYYFFDIIEIKLK